MSSKNIIMCLVALICVLHACKDGFLSGHVEACFNYTPSEGLNTESAVVFSNCSKNATNFLWLFGDGSTSNEENPIHTFAKEDSFRVILIAQNEPLSDVNADEILTIDDRLADSDTFSLVLSVVDNFFTDLKDIRLMASEYYMPNAAQTFYFDLDKDSVMDLLINLTTHYSSMYGYGNNIRMTPQNGYEVSYSNYSYITWDYNPQTKDTTYQNHNVLLPITYECGDTIKMTDLYTSKTVDISSNEYPAQASHPEYHSGIHYGIQANTYLYIAFKKPDDSNTKIAWLKVNSSGGSMIYLNSCRYVLNQNFLVVE